MRGFNVGEANPRRGRCSRYVCVGVGNAVGRVQRFPRGLAGYDGLIDAVGTKQFREKKPLPRSHGAWSLSYPLP